MLTALAKVVPPFSPQRNNCLGLEDVTAYFADGLEASISPSNSLVRQGWPLLSQLFSVFFLLCRVPCGGAVRRTAE
jgi:hypothetical protein